MVINSQTKIAALIKHHPDALEAIVSLRADFKKLRNPILRKLMAGRTSISMASKIGGCTPQDFFDKLKPYGFEAENLQHTEEESFITQSPLPAFITELQDASIIPLDVRSMLAGGNEDVDFAMMMKSHHQGAVDMAKTQLSSGTDATLKQIAQKLVDTQSAEISELQSFIDSHKSPEKNYDPAKKDDGFAKHMSDNMNMMMQMPKVEAGASVDKQFVQMMIPHHQSGIHMAEGYLQHGEDQGLKSLANKTIKDSKKEIEDFKRWEESQNK